MPFWPHYAAWSWRISLVESGDGRLSSPYSNSFSVFLYLAVIGWICNEASIWRMGSASAIITSEYNLKLFRSTAVFQEKSACPIFFCPVPGEPAKQHPFNPRTTLPGGTLIDLSESQIYREYLRNPSIISEQKLDHLSQQGRIAFGLSKQWLRWGHLILDNRWALEIKGATSIKDKHLKGMRALKEEGHIQNFAAVSCDRHQRKTKDNITIFPWKRFLEHLWNGEII